MRKASLYFTTVFQYGDHRITSRNNSAFVMLLLSDTDGFSSEPSLRSSRHRRSVGPSPGGRPASQLPAVAPVSVPRELWP